MEYKYKLLLKVLSDSINKLSVEAKRAKCKAFWMKLILVTLTTSISILLAAEIDFIPKSSQMALIISGLVTILTTMDQFLGTTSNHKILHYRIHLIQKLHLDIELVLYGDGDFTQERWLELKGRFDSIIDDSNKYPTNTSKENSKGTQAV